MSLAYASSLSPERFVIYQKTWVAMAFALLMIIGCSVLGWVFVFKLREQPGMAVVPGYALLGFGCLILATGALLALRLPGAFLRLNRRGGSLKLEISRHGLTIPGLKQGIDGFPFRVKPPLYPWQNIENVVFTEKLGRSFRVGRTQYFMNAICVVLKDQDKSMGITERDYYGIVKSPDGQSCVVATYGSAQPDRLLHAIGRFSNQKIHAQHYASVLFDYTNRTVSYEKHK